MTVTLRAEFSSETNDILTVSFFCQFPNQTVLQIFSSDEKIPVLKDGNEFNGTDSIIEHLTTTYAPNLVADLKNEWVHFRRTQLKAATKPDDLKLLDDFLLPRVFLSDHKLSVIDLIVFSGLNHILRGFNEKQKLSISNVIRWFDHIQHQPQIRNSPIPAVPIKGNITPQNTPDSFAHWLQQSQQASQQAVIVKSEESAPQQGGKFDTKETEPEASKEAPKQQTEAAQGKAKKKEKKDEGQPQPKQKGKGGAAAAEPEQPDITHLNIVVGRIVDVKKHPDADSLYIEQIDVGEPAPRTIVSGLVKFVSEDDLRNRDVVVLLNLKPKKARGVDSNGMVLCASDSTKSKVEPLDPPSGVAPGERITFQGFQGEADPVLNPKKKYFEKVQPDWSTSADRVATYKGIPFMTSKGPVTVKTVTGGSIS